MTLGPALRTALSSGKSRPQSATSSRPGAKSFLKVETGLTIMRAALVHSSYLAHCWRQSPRFPLNRVVWSARLHATYSARHVTNTRSLTTVPSPDLPTVSTRPPNSWIDRLPLKAQPYFHLIRADKPIGTSLLFLPCGSFALYTPVLIWILLTTHLQQHGQ